MRQKLNIKNIPCCPSFRGWGILLFFILSLSLHAQTGESILDQAADAYRKANGISAAFIMNNNVPEQGYAESFEGTIRMKGDKFVLETEDMKKWYDGKTMWSYSDNTEEVYVTTPTGDDLTFTNPAILLANYKKDFTASYKGESSLSGKKTQKIELLPKDKSMVTKVDLQIQKESHFPVQVTVHTKSGTGTITINETKTGLNHPDNIFVFNPAEYPEAEIIEL